MQMAAILSDSPEAGYYDELSTAVYTSTNQETSKRDNSTAIAGLLGVGGIAIVFLFIACGVARHKDDVALARTSSAAPNVHHSISREARFSNVAGAWNA